MKRILVIKPSSLGDIIHGLQVVQSIRVQEPEVHVTWVAEASFRSVVDACTAVDEVIVFEREGGLRGFLRLLKRIRSQDFDQVLDLQGLARSGLMAAAARAPRKIGRRDAREGAGLFCHQKVALPASQPAHAVDILAQFLPALGLRLEIVNSLRFKFPDLEWSDSPEALRGAVLLFPESRRSEKEWPHFAQFLTRAAKKHPGQRFAWCASERSAGDCPDGPNVVNLAGRTSLLQVIALIQSAAGIVANDSGPVHIAAAVGTPVLGLYGPTSPVQYGPYPLDDPKHRVIRAEDGLMESIRVERVLDSLRDALEMAAS